MVTSAMKLKDACSLEAQEEGMATQSSILAFRIPLTEEPVRLEFMELQRDRHNCSNLAPTFLGRKSMINLDSILKNRAITLPTKMCIVKAMVFSVVMYGCESRTIKKAERWRIDAFELWCWRRLLRVPWAARRSNQSILKEITPEYSLEKLMLKVKLQYFGHLMWRADSFAKSLTLGKIEVRRRRRLHRMRWLSSIIDSMDMSLSKLWEMVDRKAWSAAVHEIAKIRTQLSKWTTTTIYDSLNLPIQTFPSPYPSPLATTSLFSMPLILFHFHRWVHLCHIFDSIYTW